MVSKAPVKTENNIRENTLSSFRDETEIVSGRKWANRQFDWPYPTPGYRFERIGIVSPVKNRTADIPIQRKREEEDEESDINIFRKEKKPGTRDTNSDLTEYIYQLENRGSPLPRATRQFFESRFNHDFSDVRIHTDTNAVRSARSVQALAYTVNNNIVFNQSRFSPATYQGKKLLAHELTHVVQQKSYTDYSKKILQRQADHSTPSSEESARWFVSTLPRTWRVQQAIFWLGIARNNIARGQPSDFIRAAGIVNSILAWLRTVVTEDNLRRHLREANMMVGYHLCMDALRSIEHLSTLIRAAQSRDFPLAAPQRWNYETASFRTAREYLEILTGETSSQNSSLYRGVQTSGRLAVAVTAAITLPFVITTAGAAAPAAIVAEAELMAYTARSVYVLAIQNPGAALAIAEFSAGVLIQIISNGPERYISRLLTPEGFILAAGDIIMLVISLGASRGSRSPGASGSSPTQTEVPAEVQSVSSGRVTLRIVRGTASSSTPRRARIGRTAQGIPSIEPNPDPDTTPPAPAISQRQPIPAEEELPLAAGGENRVITTSPQNPQVPIAGRRDRAGGNRQGGNQPREDRLQGVRRRRGQRGGDDREEPRPQPVVSTEEDEVREDSRTGQPFSAPNVVPPFEPITNEDGQVVRSQGQIVPRPDGRVGTLSLPDKTDVAAFNNEVNALNHFTEVYNSKYALPETHRLRVDSVWTNIENPNYPGSVGHLNVYDGRRIVGTIYRNVFQNDEFFTWSW